MQARTTQLLWRLIQMIGSFIEGQEFDTVRALIIKDKITCQDVINLNLMIRLDS